ncbi:lambda-crystallin homolog [Xenopus tropicalis]|uniref:LOC100145620 protein n=1 Tax=Xenopus tropicalis TaxID=8364 RepID=B1H3F7_XENTR|nr:lambda-crystallin homolog [Xenopus tropicalis]AAI61379.1 LOC100145620 protein [Xenopus tropicalis]|eukprot:NP_001120498.1 lambda-crystallin homolog [Xenopus tropicalis]
MNELQEGNIVIVGSGLIGRSWAMVFASGGFRVKLYDIVQEQVSTALEDIRKQMEELKKSEMLRGALSMEDQMALISGCTDLKYALHGAQYIQECVPENLDLKRKIFSELDLYVDDSTIISSSTSCLSPTSMFTGLQHVKNCIVAHPVNPPYYVPLVELVPHPQTEMATVERTYNLMKKVGQSPVKLMKEMDGFVLNRLQYAVISEAWRLVQDGVISPRDVDLVMSEGLGMRYAFLGPLETAHLNAEGFKSYCERYGEGIKRVLATFGPVPDFEGEVAEKIDQALWEDVRDKADQLKAGREYRNTCLSHLAKLKKEMKKN